MANKKMILLPLDGSEASLAALLPAKSLGILLNTTVRIINISDEDIPKDKLIQKLNLKKEDLAHCIMEHKQGSPTEVIVKEGKESSYIVMSTHGKTGDLSKLTGSIAASVIEKTEIPVILIRPDVSLSIKDNLWYPQKALIPLNGTPGASRALEPAIEFLAKTDAEIDLLHISTSGQAHPSEPGSLTTPYYEDYPQYEWPSWSKEFLKRFCTVMGHENINPKLCLSKGDPGDEIITYAMQNNNDIIAMAWHGKLGELKALTFKKVMMNSPCPVLLIRITDTR